MNKKQHILIVEDEPAIHAGLTDVFIYHGYDVTVAEDGEEGCKLALRGKFDLVLLDVMLPKRNGFEVCETIRSKYPAQPIIMLTAMISDDEIVQGLRLGADDYITKPFSVEQLVLRVAAVLRRSSQVVAGRESVTEIDLGSWQVDVRSLAAVNVDGRCTNAAGIPGIPADKAPLIEAPGFTLPLSSRYIFLCALNGAVSRASIIT